MAVLGKEKLILRRLYLSGQQVTPNRSATDYLQGVTMGDVTTSSTIDPDGTPRTRQVIDVRNAITGQTFASYDNTLCEVYYDSTAKTHFVQPLPGGNKFFIYDPSQDVALGSESNVFEFYVNPRHITPQYTKSRTQIRTLGGWEIQHWGNELTTLTVQGTSGGMHRVNEGGVNRGLHIGDPHTLVGDKDAMIEQEGIRSSTAWKRLEQLRQIYQADHALRNVEQPALWSLEYQGRVYVGSFSAFTGPEEDADKPYMLAYSFAFVVEEEKSGQRTRT